MSACFEFRCPACGFEIEAWDSGNPYIIDDDGLRHFFYHPAESDVIEPVVARSRWAAGKSALEIEAELPNHVGCMEDVICLECAATAQVDYDECNRRCATCGSETHRILELGGKRCPKCKQGRFPDEPTMGAIS